MQKYKKFLWPAVIALIVFGVAAYFIFGNRNKASKFIIDPQFAEYISAITTGVVSCETTIKVVLVEPYSGDSTKKNEAIKKIFSFKPSISGTTRWIDDRTIEFIPDKKLKSGQLYEAVFKLGKVQKVPDKFKELNFGFRVMYQSISVTEEGLHSYSGTSNEYYLEGTVKTADVADNNDVEKTITNEISGQKKPVRWEHSEDRKTHRFVIDSVARNHENQLLNIGLDGNEIGVKKEDKLSVEVPAIGVFKVMDAKQVYYPEQCIKVIFSDQLDVNQNLSGIIKVSNNNEPRFTIENNQVKVYVNNNEAPKSFVLSVSQEVRNDKGKQLEAAFEKTIIFQQNKPAVEILGKGVIMPNSGQITLPFRAVNLKAVDVEIVKIFENNIPQFLQVNNLNGMQEIKRVGRSILKQKIDLIADHPVDYGVWNNFSVDISKLVKTEPGALYRITFSFKHDYSLYPCGAASDSLKNSEEETEISWDDESSSSEYDSEEYEYYDYGEDYWENRENPCHPAYYKNTDHKVSRNVLASNLGIIGKVNKNNLVSIAVTNLLDTKPISGATVDILDYQNQVLGTVNTDNDGFANFKAPHAPYLLIVKKGEERGYLSLSGGSSLSLSTFDVGGDEVQKGLKGFIYGERGVWRPGDTLFISFILEDKNKNYPSSIPVVCELTDPKNRLYKRLVKTSGVNGFYKFILPTDPKVLTGFWNIKVKAAGAIFNKSVRIEAIKPNRLEINLDITNGKAYTQASINGKLHAQWLHGALAGGLKTKITAKLSKGTTTFNKFSDYCFDDPSKSFSSEEQEVFDGRLDAQGNAHITGTLKASNDAPGFIKASFTTKVFEEGGDFSIDNYSVNYSPFSIYAGVKANSNNQEYNSLIVDSTHTIKIATVTADGVPVSRNGLKFNVYKLEWRWWWDASDNDIASYFGNSYNNPVMSQTVSTTNGYGQVNLRLTHEGRYLIRVTDPAGHSCAQTVYVDWPWWRPRSSGNDPAGATLLNLAPDKGKYKVGEKAQISLPAGNKGRALVSIESGSRILEMFWVDLKDAKNNRPVIEIPIKAEMAPNVFVNVTLLQPHKNTLNDMPIRLYGYTSLLVENPETRLEPELTLPAQVGSEEAFKISVKEKKGKAMTYTLAIVDEGLLGITRFKTTDPHETFYAREALGIKTWDMFDLVFGAFGGKIEQIFGIGGDQDLGGVKGQKNAERFKPVVQYLGPFTLGKGKINTHAIKLPKYNGAVRVMLVAGQNGAYGVAEKKLLVKDALMATATLPRVLSPSETVDMPVTIFADELSIKNVAIQVQSNALLQPIGAKSKSLAFAKPGSKTINFSFKVASTVGIAKAKVIATSGKYKAEYNIELDVRNPNSNIVNFTGALVQASGSWNYTLNLPGMPGTNKATIEVSSFPPLDLGRHLSYLINYPHGCIEQTTSGVFPQLYLNKVMNLSDENKVKTETNVKAGLERLKSFQLSDGSFSYWPGSNSFSDWGTNYAGHFMVEAEKEGYKLPAGLKQAWIKFQQNKARNYSGNNLYPWDELAQSYRLYTLALAGQPEMGSMNRLREKANLSQQSRWQLASAYLITGQKEVALKLIDKQPTTINPYIETGGSFGSDLRDQAMILEALSLLKDNQRAMTLAEAISKRLSTDSWLSTQTASYCLVALSKFAGASGLANSGLKFSYSIDGASTDVAENKALFQIKPNVTAKQRINIAIANKNKSNLYVRIISEGIPLIGHETDGANNLSMDVSYKLLNGSTINPEKIKQGTDFKVLVTIRNLSQTSCQNLALTQVVPSGWEIINTRLAQDAAIQSSVYDYQDIRDDRLLTYFNLNVGEAKTFTLNANATYRGKFYLPVMKCEAMYDNRIYARKAGRWITID
jgi:uncharacterized protein YfaS (alpha-2-macroglobulin family)